jgi:hypothetical protein
LKNYLVKFLLAIASVSFAAAVTATPLPVCAITDMQDFTGKVDGVSAFTCDGAYVTDPDGMSTDNVVPVLDLLYIALAGDVGWELVGKSNQKSVFKANPNGSTGTLKLVSPITGVFAFSLSTNQNPNWSLYIFDTSTPMDIFKYDTKGTALKDASDEGLSLAILWACTGTCTAAAAPPVSVSEPGSLVLAGLALAGLFARRKRT